jgi:hypothetical protein
MSDTFKTPIKQILPLAIILIGIVSYNFMSAAWTAPTSTPPNSNTEAPIDVSSDAQIKLGPLGVGALYVTGNAGISGQVRTAQYCDILGSNCFELSTTSAGYTSYASAYCGLNLTDHRGRTGSLHGVILQDNSFYDFYNDESIANLKWLCDGPNNKFDFEIEQACGLRVPNPGSTSLNVVRLQNGTLYDLYDSNRATAILEWSCQ